MSKKISSRLFAIAAIVMLCLSPAALADDGLTPFSFFDSVKAFFLDLGDWLGDMVDGGSTSNEEPPEEDGGVPDLGGAIDPFG